MLLKRPLSTVKERSPLKTAEKMPGLGGGVVMMLSGIERFTKEAGPLKRSRLSSEKALRCERGGMAISSR